MRHNVADVSREVEVNWKLVARDTLILWCFTALGGMVVGFALGLMGAAQSPKAMIAIGFSNLVLGIVGFAIVGALAKANRFRHLLVVTIAVWITSLVNVPIFGVGIGHWALSLLFLLLIMLVGGGISLLLTARPAKTAQVGEPVARA